MNISEISPGGDDIAIYLKIGERYWAPLQNENCIISAAKDLNEVITLANKGTSLVSHSVLQAALGAAKLGQTNYLLIVADEYVAWRPTGPSRWISRNTDQEYTEELFRYHVEAIIHRFHREHLNTVREKINDPAASPDQIAKAVCAFLFCDHYSVWFYSRWTQHFTLLCASFTPDRTFIPFDARDATLQGALRADSDYTEKAVDTGKVHSAQLGAMSTALRCRLDLRHSRGKMTVAIDPPDKSVAILTCYSHLPGFSLTAIQKRELELALETLIGCERAIFTGRSTLLLDSIMASYQPGQLDQFFSKVTESITGQCEWEASSIFIIDEQTPPTKLELRAYGSKAVPSRPTLDNYPINVSSKTAAVFKSGKLKFSYDIEQDPENTHRIDDATVNPPENWLAVPILHAAMPVGVLRAKNKTSAGRVVAFHDLDIALLRHFADLCGYVYGIEAEANAERRRQAKALAREKEQLDRETSLRKELERTNEQLTDFIITFQHELKSPLTIFTRIRQRLERALRFHGLMAINQPLPKRLRELCEDTQVLAERLAFVTSTMELHPSDIVQELRWCDCFKEIVAPILTFAVLYARNRGLELRCHRQSLFMPVYCDPMAASLALHTLIDNAIKYADPGSVISIDGIPRADLCTIRVSNYGLPIPTVEADRIFDKRFRGAEAQKQRIGGAGVGLYLAREIMERNNGAVALVSLENPVSFELAISASQKRGKV